MKHFLILFMVLITLAGCTAAKEETLNDATAAQATTLCQTEALTESTEDFTEETSKSTAAETAPVTEETQPVTEETIPEATPEVDPLVLLLDSMTTEEVVGQLFLARCPDVGALEDIEKYHLGGYILFGRDFDGQTPDSIRGKLNAYQSAAKIPLLIAVDEEGGTVCRVSNRSAFRSSRFPSPRKLYDEGGFSMLFSAESEKCQLLSGLGINVNMAPVCDITTNPDAFMYSRSLGQSPAVTAQFIEQTVQIMHEHGIGSVLKHFPGYGENADTHVGIAVDHRSIAELESVDLIPFRAGIEANCGAILVSHTIVMALDDTLPASLSPAVHEYLRVSMGFDGVIVTDDLVMQAITDEYGAGQAAVLAVLAGNDLLCSTQYATQYRAVLKAVQDGTIPEELLREAVLRVLRWKQSLGLLEAENTAN